MISLIGVGGVGKTRLASELAHEVCSAFLGGVWWVSLVDVAGADRVPDRMITALRIMDQTARPALDVLVEHLRRSEPMLVIIDNCEHLAHAVTALVSAMISQSNTVRVLTTSRQRLGLRAEHAITIPPLPVPTLANPRGNAAYELLADRAAAVGHPIEGSQVQDAARLCQLVDGLPLALVLAARRLAARTPAELGQSPAEVYDVLSRRISALGTDPAEAPHHITLEASFEASRDRCTPPARKLWAVCSVFEGSFDASAVQALCDLPEVNIDEWELADLLDELVFRSVLDADVTTDRTTRYRLLVPIREYGAARLREFGGLASAVHERHRDHFLVVAQRAAATWQDHEESTLRQMHADSPNLASAIDWSLRHDDIATAQNIAANWVACRQPTWSGFLPNARRELQRVYRPSGHVQLSPLLVTTMALDVWAAVVQGARPEAETLLEEARAKAAQLGGPLIPALSYAHGSYHIFGYTTIEGLSRGVDLLKQAVAEFAAIGDTGGTHQAKLFVGLGIARLGPRSEALDVATEVLREAETFQDARWAYAWAHWNAGWTHLWQGDPATSLTHFDASEQHFAATGDGWGNSWAPMGQGCARALLGHFEEAAELLGVSDGMRQPLQIALDQITLFANAQDEAVQRIEATIGHAAFRRAFERGRRTVIERQNAASTAPAPTQDSPIRGLTDRELEVAHLVAQGLDNVAIAQKLVLSRRTIERHLANIFHKLDLEGTGSRTQLAVMLTQSHSQ